MPTDLFVVMGWSWVVCGVAGLGLALHGLHLAHEDRRAIRRAGTNGLMLYLSDCTARSWLVRVALQAIAIVWGLTAVSTPAPVVPADAGADAVLRLLVLRWLLIAVSVLLVGQSALDLWGRRRAGEIADESPEKGGGGR